MASGRGRRLDNDAGAAMGVPRQRQLQQLWPGPDSARVQGPRTAGHDQNSPIGALALFLTPLAVSLLTGPVAWATYKRRDTTIYGAVAGVLPLLIMFTGGGVNNCSQIDGFQYVMVVNGQAGLGCAPSLV